MQHAVPPGIRIDISGRAECGACIPQRGGSQFRRMDLVQRIWMPPSGVGFDTSGAGSQKLRATGRPNFFPLAIEPPTMANYRLFKLALDPGSLDEVRAHFDHLAEKRETFERGLAMENMNAEAAWLDEEAPALYYLHEEGANYPADLDPEDVDDPAVMEMSETHHGFFHEVTPEDVDHPEDLVEIEPLFAASARGT